MGVDDMQGIVQSFDSVVAQVVRQISNVSAEQADGISPMSVAALESEWSIQPGVSMAEVASCSWNPLKDQSARLLQTIFASSDLRRGLHPASCRVVGVSGEARRTRQWSACDYRSPLDMIRDLGSPL